MTNPQSADPKPQTLNPKPYIRVGPAGWSYDDWKGIVYPSPMPKSLHPLEFLCALFDTIEINSSFYRPPNPRYCASWIEKIAANPRFKFTIKLWERFTHHGGGFLPSSHRQRETEFTPEEVRTFAEGIAPLAREGKLGALLVQFPWSFKRTPDNRRWLARVLDAFAEYPLALEIRHASWDCPEVYSGLAARRIAFCNIDQPQFRDSIEPTERVTARVGYVRLHGRNHGDWFREDASRDERYDYLYSEAELAPWIAKVENLRAQTDEVYVITNNHYRGQAVVNALEIQAALGKTEFILPRHLIEEYPRLKKLLPTQT